MGRNKSSKCSTICRRRRLPDSNFTLFSFLLDVDRCRMWIQTGGLEELLHIPIELIQSNRLICESHFTPECFKTYRRKCLTQSAIPTLNLKHPPLSHELLAKFPLHVGKENINTGYNPLREHNYGVHMRFTLENMDKTERARNSSCVQLAEIPVASTCKTPDAFRVAKLPLGPISQFAEIPVASSSKRPDSLNVDSETSVVVEGHIRTKSSNLHVETSTLTAREKRLLAKLQSAKLTLKALAKSRMNLDNLDSDMLKEFASNMLRNQKKKPEAKSKIRQHCKTNLEGQRNKGVFSTPGKHRAGRPRKELDNFNLCAIRQKVQFFYTVKKITPTLRNLLPVVREELGFNGSREHLRKILIALGFRYKRSQSDRQALMEKLHIAAKREAFLDKIIKERNLPDKLRKEIIYLDESYIYILLIN